MRRVLILLPTIVLLAATGACGGDRGSAPPGDPEASWPGVDRSAIHAAVLEHTRSEASTRVCEWPCEIGAGDVAVVFGPILGGPDGPVVVETTVQGTHGTDPGLGWGHRGTHHLRRRDGRWIVEAHTVQVMEEYVRDGRFTP